MHIFKALTLTSAAILAVHTAPSRSFNSTPIAAFNSTPIAAPALAQAPNEMPLISFNGAVARTAKPDNTAGCGINNLDCAAGRLKWIDCYLAANKLDPKIRYARDRGLKNWMKAGVCHGTCILRVYGDVKSGKSRCDLTGREMAAAFNKLTAMDCRDECGWVQYPDECSFRMEYIDPKECWMPQGNWYSGEDMID